MTPWFLMVALAGPLGGVADVKAFSVTHRQCLAALYEMSPLRGHLGAACIGLNGERASLATIKNKDVTK